MGVYFFCVFNILLNDHLHVNDIKCDMRKRRGPIPCNTVLEDKFLNGDSAELKLISKYLFRNVYSTLFLSISFTAGNTKTKLPKSKHVYHLLQ